MLVFNIFVEISEQQISTSYLDVTLKRVDFQHELKKAVANYRALQNPIKVQGYKHWLVSFERALQDQDEIFILPVLLDLLSNETSSIDAMLACRTLSQLYYLNTQHQHNALSFARMGKALIDRPIAFAAFLRCLCLHDLQPNQILATYLLHDFFRYYMNQIGDTDNPIAQLYGILNAFPETKKLAEEAQSVSSDERGFSTYALTGEAKNHAGINIQKQQAPLYFTPEINNLKGLHAMFGLDFLMAALEQWQVQKPNALWHDYIYNTFNHISTINNQLPLIFNQIYELMPLQQALAEILSDDTLSLLLSQKKANILCLVPFRPQLVLFIQTQNLEHYLNNLRQNVSSKLVFISGLFSYLDAIKHGEKEVIQVVFLQLVDAILEENYVLEDEYILRKLHKYKDFKACVIQKINQLEAELDEIITLQTSSSISDMDYLTIEDGWRQIASKMKNLQEFFSFETSCPENKYGLYMRLAKIYYSKNGSFKLNEYITALNISPVFSPVEITIYERVIIELLGAIDHEALRNECIALLDENIPIRDWRNHKYGDKYHFQRAIENSNVGFIQWLETQHIKPHTTYDSLAIEAARYNHWPVVLYILKRHPLNSAMNNALLHMAVNQGAANAISMLWSKSKQLPTTAQIEQTFLLAAKKNDADSITAIIQYLKAPKDSTMVRAFKNAINLKALNAAEAIASYQKGDCLLEIISDTIIEAARLNHCEILNHLIKFACSTIIEKAFLSATRANHKEAAAYFLGHTNPPQQKTITQAWNEAKRRKRSIAIDLEKLCQTSASLKIIDVDKDGLNHPESKTQSSRVKTTQPIQLHRSNSCSTLEKSPQAQHGFFRLRKVLSEASALNLNQELMKKGM